MVAGSSSKRVSYSIGVISYGLISAVIRFQDLVGEGRKKVLSKCEWGVSGYYRGLVILVTNPLWKFILFCTHTLHTSCMYVIYFPNM